MALEDMLKEVLGGLSKQLENQLGVGEGQAEQPGDARQQGGAGSAPAPAGWPPTRGGSPTYPQRQQESFRELFFSTQVRDDGHPVNPSSRIPAGIDTVYATFEFAGMQDGTPWSIAWMNNGQRIVDQQDQWDDGPQGRKAIKISNRNGLPGGEYHLLLGIRGSVALEGIVLVGSPVDPTDSEVSGRLVDSRSKAGVVDGMVLVLKPGASLQQFLRSQDQRLVFTSTQSGPDGRFTLPQQLPKGQSYSLIAGARGYNAVAVEGALRIGSTAPEHADIGNIELTAGF